MEVDKLPNLITNLSSQSMLDSMRDPVSVVDNEGIIRYANPSFIYTTGIPLNDLIGKQLLDTLCADSISKKQREEWKSEFQRTIKNGEVTCSEYVIKREDDLTYLASTTSVLRNDYGETSGAIITFTNITDTKRIMEELQKLQRAIEHSPVSVVVTDAKSIIEYTNPKFAQLTGYSAEESIGQNPRILQSGQTPTETFVDMWKTISSGHEWRGVFINKKKDGVLYWEDSWISPVKGPSGYITHYVAVKEDITARLRTEEDLWKLNEELEKRVEERTKDFLESEVQYMSLFQNAQVGMFRTRISDGKIIAFNETGTRLLGFNNPDEIISEFVVSESFVNPSAHQHFVDLLMKDGKITNFQAQITKRDGTPIWVELSSIVIQEEGGIHVVVDITDRKRWEQSLKESEAILRATIEATANGILVIDNNREVLLTNTQFAKLWDIPEEIVDTRSSELLLDTILDHVNNPIELEQRVKHLSKSPRIEFDRIELSDERTYEMYTSPLVKEGKVFGRVWSFKDNTSEEQSKQQLIHTRNRAEFFVDLMSHDLTNINQAVVGVLDFMLYDESLQEYVAETIREALYQVQRGTQLITNVRKFTKIDNDPPEIFQQDPAAALKAAIRAVNDDVPLKTLHVKTNIVQGEFQVQADEYLTDVFYSLLHNALRYNPNDEVEVEVSIGTSEDEAYLRIEVSDQGQGIPDTYKDKLFERIVLKNEGHLGTGIGLTLLRHIVDHYGGKVWMEDRLKGDYSKGARVVLLLPGGEA